MSLDQYSNRKFLNGWFLAGLILLVVTQGSVSVAQQPSNAATDFLPKTGDSDRFVDLAPEVTGITLVNEWKPAQLHRSLSFGVWGTGVAIGDYDGDGLQDVFVAQQSNAGSLYRNLGGMKFEDVTEKVGINPAGMWTTGTTFVDINNDGQLDLFLCGFHCPCRLYINTGGQFVEKANEFGLDYDGASVTMLFSDYDRDGDLDAYLVTNYKKVNKNIRAVRPIVRPGKPPEAPEAFKEYFYFIKHPDGKYRRTRAGQYDYLFRNDNGKFVDATESSGIGKQAFIGLAASWWDYNNDGWPDLYVSNDFRGPDFLYRNNGPDKNGEVTFTNVIDKAIPHTPWFSMGGDFADINNDGRFDYIATDMAGTSHYRDKLSMGEMSGADSMLWFLNLPTPPQYMRNAVYLNTGTERFMEVAFLTGLAKSDWTWTAKFADFDNDGWQDIYFTNGMTRDTFNGDLRAKERNVVQAYLQTAKKPLRTADVRQGFWESQEPYRLENMAFRNRGDLKFENKGRDWGLDHLGVNTGGAVGDLDNDGDLDLVITGFEERTRVYRNDVAKENSLRIKLVGKQSNRDGLGARITVASGGATQVRFVSPTSGFMSTSENVQHFGLGKQQIAETITIHWPSGLKQVLNDVSANQLHYIAESGSSRSSKTDTTNTLFKRDNRFSNFPHQETAYDDFEQQPLLPNKYSQLGPGMAWGDIDDDGDDDLFLGSATFTDPQLLINTNGQFTLSTQPDLVADAKHEDMGAVFFDADGDNDLDLYVVSGGVESEAGNDDLQDRLYLNDGKGNFQRTKNRLPDMKFSGSSVSVCDFDKDGDLDLFVGGRIIPGAYPESPRSALLANEQGSFTDQTIKLAKETHQAGMVTSAIWSDVDGDDWPDLLVAYEWGPVRYYQNQKGQLVDKTQSTELAKNVGWFNSIAAGDIDNDGDMDYVVGNFGLNTKYKVSNENPAVLYYGDFEGLGRKRIVEAKFEDGVCLPRRGLSCSSHAMPMVRKKKPTFHDFAISDLDDIYTEDKLTEATKLEANELRSLVLINQSNNGVASFSVRPLPRIAQASPIFGIGIEDVNLDSNLDLVVAQNFYGPQRETGYMDGGISLLLMGDGKGKFSPTVGQDSGIVVIGDATSLTASDLNDDGKVDFLVGRNNDSPVAFIGKISTNDKLLKSINLRSKFAGQQIVGGKIKIRSANGTSRLHEVILGSGYLSANSPRIFAAEIIETNWLNK